MVRLNHPERTACEKPRRRLLFNTAIGGPRESGFQSVSDRLRMLRHPWNDSIQSYVQSNRLNNLVGCPKIPNSQIAPQAGKIGASASGPPVGCRASDGIKPSGHCSRSHTQPSGAQTFPEGRHVPLIIIGGNHENENGNRDLGGRNGSSCRI